MELTQLKYFLNTANCGQITRAAELLHVSQSAISTAISKLESELGVELFCKSGRNITLTENGNRFVAMITPAMAELDFARSELLRTGKDNEPNTITLTVELPDFVSELERFYYRHRPDAKFRQSSDSSEIAAQKLRCNAVDFCLSFEPFNDPEIISELIFHDRVMIQLPKSHPLADRKSLWLSDVADEYFVSFSSEFSFRRWMEGMCYLAGFRPNMRFEVCDTQAIMTTLMAHNAVSFIGEFSWAHLDLMANTARADYPITAIPLNDAFCVRNCYLCYHQNRILSPEARDFRLFTQRFYHTLLEHHDPATIEQALFPGSAPPTLQ